MSAPLVGVTPIFAVCFWGNDMGKLIAVRVEYGVVATVALRIESVECSQRACWCCRSHGPLHVQRKAMSTPDHQQLSMGQLMFAGGFSAIPATVRSLSPPLYTIKNRTKRTETDVEY